MADAFVRAWRVVARAPTNETLPNEGVTTLTTRRVTYYDREEALRVRDTLRAFGVGARVKALKDREPEPVSPRAAAIAEEVPRG